MHPEIAKYVKEYVFNSERVATKKCIKEELPYIDLDTGNIYNTHKFREAGLRYMREGLYTNHPSQSDGWFAFWNEERKRCREGYWCGQIRVTGYHYFMMNFHRMKILYEGEEQEGFGGFMRLQYFLFHLIDYADYVKMNFAFIKLRSCGASECAAAIGEADCLVPPIRLQEGRMVKQMPSNAYFASNSNYLGGDDGIFTKMTKSMTWLTQNTDGGMYEPFAINSSGDTMHWMVGQRDTSQKPIQQGGEIIARVVKKPDDARGGRKRRVFHEESGANPNLTGILGVVQSNLKRLDAKTGIQVIWGTSNEKADGIQAFKDVLQNPRGVYQTLAFRNAWRALEKGEDGFADIPWNPFEYLLHETEDETNIVGYFIPAYELRVRDKDGNPDRIAGYRRIMEERERLQKSSSDDRGLLAFIADNPIYMEEALLVSRGKRFNHDGLAQQLVKIDTGILKPKIYRGVLDYDRSGNKVTGIVFWEDKTGKVIITEMPSWAKKKGNGWFIDVGEEKTWQKYIAGIDGIDQGTNESSTKGSNMACLIKKRMNIEDGALSDEYADSYVALYNHRSADARDDYENVYKLLLFFNAQALLEFSKLRIRDFIVDEKKAGKYLALEPSAPGERINSFKRNKFRRGLRATTDVISFYVELIDSYIRDNYHKIVFKDLLNQLLEYSVEEKTKFDLIAAMGMCEVLNAELRNVRFGNSDRKEELFPKKLGWYVDPHTGYKRLGDSTVTDPERFFSPERQIAYYDKYGGNDGDDESDTIIYVHGK